MCKLVRSSAQEQPANKNGIAMSQGSFLSSPKRQMANIGPGLMGPIGLKLFNIYSHNTASFDWQSLRPVVQNWIFHHPSKYFLVSLQSGKIFDVEHVMLLSVGPEKHVVLWVLSRRSNEAMPHLTYDQNIN